jgi:hypothetical protein
MGNKKLKKKVKEQKKLAKKHAKQQGLLKNRQNSQRKTLSTS